MSVPHFDSRDDYRAYMAERRAAYEAAPPQNKTTSGPPIPLADIRRFQQSHGITNEGRNPMPAQRLIFHHKSSEVNGDLTVVVCPLRKAKWAAGARRIHRPLLVTKPWSLAWRKGTPMACIWRITLWCRAGFGKE